MPKNGITKFQQQKSLFSVYACGSVLLDLWLLKFKFHSSLAKIELICHLKKTDKEKHGDRTRVWSIVTESRL